MCTCVVSLSEGISSCGAERRMVCVCVCVCVCVVCVCVCEEVCVCVCGVCVCVCECVCEVVVCVCVLSVSVSVCRVCARLLACLLHPYYTHTCSRLIAILSHLGQSSFAKALTIAAGSFLLGKGSRGGGGSSRVCKLSGSSSGGFWLVAAREDLLVCGVCGCE